MSSSKGNPVAQGGLFSTPKATFSKETQELLKVMMQESKLTNFQQRQLGDKLKCGQSLPLRCHPSSSTPSKPDRSIPNKLSRTPQPRCAQGRRNQETVRRLLKETDDDTEYQPSRPRYNSAVEKERLHNIMAFGQELTNASVTTPAQAHSKHDQIDEPKDRFEEVLQEIEDRQEFLEEMEALGQDRQYHSKIQTEISQRIRELELIDIDRMKREFTAAAASTDYT